MTVAGVLIYFKVFVLQCRSIVRKRCPPARENADSTVFVVTCIIRALVFRQVHRAATSCLVSQGEPNVNHPKTKVPLGALGHQNSAF